MAESQFKKACSILEESLGVDHIEVADVLYNLGFVAKAKRDKSTAIAIWNRGLAIVDSKLGVSHPKHINFVNAIAMLQ